MYGRGSAHVCYTLSKLQTICSLLRLAVLSHRVERCTFCCDFLDLCLGACDCHEPTNTMITAQLAVSLCLWLKGPASSTCLAVVTLYLFLYLLVVYIVLVTDFCIPCRSAHMGSIPDCILMLGSGGVGGLWGVQVPPAQRHAPGDQSYYGPVHALGITGWCCPQWRCRS